MRLPYDLIDSTFFDNAGVQVMGRGRAVYHSLTSLNPL